MKEKVFVIMGLLLVSYGIYGIISTNNLQQYNYNGGVLKSVDAMVVVDNKSVYTGVWHNDIDKVIINVSSENVKPSKGSSAVIPPPPPRHSH